MSKRNKYEAKEKELRKKFRNKRLILWIVWLIIAVAINITVILLKSYIRVEVLFMIIIIINALSLFIVKRKNAELKIIEKNQLALIEQEEPFGKFRA